MMHGNLAGGQKDPSRGQSPAEAPALHHLCSFAITGPREYYQAIYVCRSCCSASSFSCVCQACADACHYDHEVEYIGMGPCYCDCREIGCKIVDQSVAAAARWGAQSDSDSSGSSTKTLHFPLPQDEDKDPGHYIREFYRIPALEDVEIGNRLVRQAEELVKHSKETFWLDEATVTTAAALSDLEVLTWQIFRRHLAYYDLEERGLPCGAEWWVQVKQVSLPSRRPSILLESKGDGTEAVDLHYDKDEVLAESFGLGCFPSHSTVTYLTGSINAPPTVVFSRRYDEQDDDPINEMLISRPSRAKHLVFDGRLLHGAPSHFALRPLSTAAVEKEEPRVTILVNVWVSHKPFGVDILSETIRNAICSKLVGIGSTLTEKGKALCLIGPSKPAEVDLTDVSDLPEVLRERIDLPFVGGTATWADDDDDDEEGEAMVIRTFPPPADARETFTVRFGSGLEAYIEYDSL